MKAVFWRSSVNGAVRSLLLLAVLMFVFCVPSCAPKERDHLAYQSYPIKAECLLSVMEESYPFTLDIASAENARLTFTGSRLEGAVIGVSGGDVFFINGDHTFPLAAAKKSPLFLIARAFALESSEMTEVEEGDGFLRISYRCGEMTVCVTLSDGKPTVMEFMTDGGDFELKLNEFTCGAR